MRGKDFCRNILSTNLSNLGEGVWPTFAVFLDKLSYQKKEDNTKPLCYDMSDNVTTLYASNNTLANDQNILGGDDLISMRMV